MKTPTQKKSGDKTAFVFSADDAAVRFAQWEPKALQDLRRNWRIPKDQYADFLQETYLRFHVRYVINSVPIENTDALFSTILRNLIRNAATRSFFGLPLLGDVPSQPGKADEDRREDIAHAKWLIGKLQSQASPQEQRAVAAYLETGEHQAAVDFQMSQATMEPDTRRQRRKKANAYRVAMTRFYARARLLKLGDE